MLNVGGRPSALASVAARAVGAASPTVSFEVVHVWSGQGKFERGLPADVISLSGSTDDRSVPRETLCSEVPGARFSIRTWSSREPHAVPAEIPVEPIDLGHGNVQNNSYPYHGSIALNPNFLYDSARSTEMLLTLDREAWKPDYADTLMVALVIYKVASVVAETAKAPIIFLQSPVSPYRDTPLPYYENCSGEKPRLARSLAIRLAVGVDESSADQRLKIITDIAALAAYFGIGLQVADRQLGRVRGEWWTVSEPQHDVYERLKSKFFDWRPEDVPTSARLLTFVGPARIGSLVEIMDYLFSGNDFGILAIAMSTLQEIAFVNVLVAVTPTGARHLSVDPSIPIKYVSAGHGRIVSEDGTRSPLRGGVKFNGSVLSGSDYHLYSTGPVSLSMVDMAEGPEWSLWVSWELEPILKPKYAKYEVVKLILAHLKDECIEIEGIPGSYCCIDVGMEYYRARLLDNGWVRGRAKIYVRLSEVKECDAPRILGELCSRIQTKTMSDLIKKDLWRDTFSIKLAWREMWLGSSPGVV